MQKLGLTQSLQQKLSPQQIQFIKLLQVPTAELENRIEEELELNPVLEEGEPEAPEEDEFKEEAEEEEEAGKEEEIDIKDYLQDDDYSGYKTHNDLDDEEDKEMPMPTSTTLQETLLAQLGFLGLNDHQLAIGKQLIGSIEGDGYIRRDLEAIVNDLAFSQGIETTLEETQEILKKVQAFDPAGIAARNLQECLLIQLDRMDDGQDVDVIVAKRILTECYEEFTKKHYQKILKKLDLDDEDYIKDAIELIVRLNPKPGGEGSSGMAKNQYVIPDFILSNNNGKLELALNSRNAPELRISRSYHEMFKAYDKSDKKDKKLKEAVSFVKQKLDAAKWFIDAIRQRQLTLLKTMRAIVDFQYDYFLEGDETKLKPMILKDIAQVINMDISTVSRVASSKTVQTDFGVYPLKYFFSEGISTNTGEEVSSREVKQIIKDLIEEEDKTKPFSDDKLEDLLKAKGYNIARRTVAKYREQLNIPVARLRKGM
ncbi:MAG: RNA polymerase factor sigma-54 [Cyclobacteriaceae bacterium]|nr:RNA polymerase factor sigma-54 [Cyclobacteriaceae bacterium]MCB0498431.1 RNA polymerase factor sigma-54 [Cyclobacteriaceae bacterium]MCB9236999.1 RNA polymerase factor sigma-54 [Flammeovirgaceae bacterium]MCO5271645.1 RNA polymerase factor sigma-54 [Cyclobacteriaceae bacterium]MCW5901291.1 RNA polymerase factor sigma-54 [Cyclobacteriaceae bacterium]